MEKDVIITYESLYEILRREKSRPELQKLDENFFKDVLKYIEEKKSIFESQSKKDSIFSSPEIDKTKKQMDSIKKILKELYEKRESKIVQLAVISSRADNEISNLDFLLPEEKSIYYEMLNLLKLSRENLLGNLLNARLPTSIDPRIDVKPKDINTVTEQGDSKLIRILNPLPKFMGTDLQVYGPFDQESMVNLPIDIANLLIKNNKAEEMKS